MAPSDDLEDAAPPPTRTLRQRLVEVPQHDLRHSPTVADRSGQRRPGSEHTSGDIGARLSGAVCSTVVRFPTPSVVEVTALGRVRRDIGARSLQGDGPWLSPFTVR